MAQQTGAELIAAERQRQIEEEGWTPEHDDRHASGELLKAAQAYEIEASTPGDGGDLWPWEMKFWKPSLSPVRNLVKAGALALAEAQREERGGYPSRSTPQYVISIAREIDRLQRQEREQQQG